MEHTDQHQCDALPLQSKKSGKARTTLAYCLVASMTGLVITLEMKRQESNRALASVTERIANQTVLPSGTQKEQADYIVSRVRELMVLPDSDPTVAAIVDVESLKARNIFYKNAKNGDFLIVTTERAIIYDPDTHRIKDVVPVQIQPLNEDEATEE